MPAKPKAKTKSKSTKLKSRSKKQPKKHLLICQLCGKQEGKFGTERQKRMHRCGQCCTASVPEGITDKNGQLKPTLSKRYSRHLKEEREGFKAGHAKGALATATCYTCAKPETKCKCKRCKQCGELLDSYGRVCRCKNTSRRGMMT